MSDASLIDTLPVTQRFALAYAPASSRQALLALFALDARLAGIVRNSHEPMLAQLRLAWWREQLALDPAARPLGDPLLAILGDAPGLAGLVDGWEGMTGPVPLFEALADARGQAFAALAESPAEKANAVRLGCNWALFDLATHLSNPQERDTVLALAKAADWRPAPLPRNLRPLAVLFGLAARAIRSDTLSANSITDLLTAMRIGWFGR
jgi:15-cis-phytoene synthase